MPKKSNISLEDRLEIEITAKALEACINACDPAIPDEADSLRTIREGIVLQSQINARLIAQIDAKLQPTTPTPRPPDPPRGIREVG